jgi:GDP-L-fucose synthase
MEPTVADGDRVLVTGGSGFLGGNLAMRLRDQGYRVRISYFRHPPRFAADGMEVVQADLCEEADCQRVVAGMDHVFMCAAVTSGAFVIRTTPLAHVTPNVVMNARMLEAAYNGGVGKFVFISSAAAYPPTGSRPVGEDEMFDADPFDAYHAAGWMKRYAEILCRTYAEKLARAMATLVIRPSNVYGPHDKFDFATSHVTAALIRKVLERHRPIEVWGTGEDVRDVIYIDDFVDGVMAAFRLDQAHLTVNIASGRGHTVKEILATAIKVDGFADAEVRFDPTKPGTTPILLVDTRRARELLGFEATVSLEEGIARTLAWLRGMPQSVWLR